MAYADYHISSGSARRRLIGVCVGILVPLATIYALNDGLKLKLVEKIFEATVVQVKSAPEPLPAPPQTIPEVVMAFEPAEVTIPPPKFKIETPPAPRAVTAKVQPPKLAPQPVPVQQPKPVQPDIMAKFRTSNEIPRYPTSAIRNCEQGLVTLSLVIGTDGRVSNARLVTSSGHPALDDAALKVARDWRYTPARRGGKAVESTLTQPIRFDLKNEIGRSMTAAEVRACLRN